jgi:hypothetical protein
MKLKLILCSLFSVISLFSIGQIPIHYVSPEKTDLLNDNSLKILKSRIVSFASKNGISGEGGYSDIVIYPVISDIDHGMIEGMQNLILYSIEVQLVVKEVNTKNIYGTFSLQSKGNGYNKSDAVKAAISKIDFNTRDGQTFMADVKQKIEKYYQDNCDKLLSKANTYSKSGEYEAAIAVCYSIPESVDCHRSALDMALTSYKYLQESKCKSQLVKADGFITNRMYSQAISVLTKIDPNTSCYTELTSKYKLIDEKLTELEKAERERIDYERKIAEENKENEQELERQRITAIKDIAVAYYQNQPKAIYKYKYIIAY